jgi:nucleoside-diphosphate-sugar epimerase
LLSRSALPPSNLTTTDFDMADSKPAVLIIGGLGYIGRFLALHIHNNNLASEVRLVDKVLPQLAWLAPEFSEACSQDKFMQADASRPGERNPLRRFDPTD